MIKANVILDHYKWKKKIKNPNNYFKKKIRKLNKLESFNEKKHQFSVLLTSNKKMRSLNFKFRKKNKPTDVLSFPFCKIQKKSFYVGDIAISFELVNKRSKKSNFFYELDKIWIHGYCHLIGYDHRKIKEFRKMNKKENLLLNYLNKTI